jgi:lycopene beta-cyclase
VTASAPDHDVIIVGAGVAGSRLLAHLLASPWRTRSILVIEREPADHRDHMLAFWTDRSSALDPLIEYRWRALRAVTADGTGRPVPLAAGCYVATRRARVTAPVGELPPGVTRLTGEVEAIVDEPEGAAVRVGDRWYRGAWVFDSRPPAPGPASVRLVQRFTGWTVTSAELRLDPNVATLFDFRTAQSGGICFIYVLPLAGDRVLVEHVHMGPTGATRDEPDDALRTYLRDQLGQAEGTYTIIAREQGSSPLSDARHVRREGRRICTIGVRGGRLKPSSGYALTRIERDSAAIVRSLTRHGHPYRIPRNSWLYGVFDAIFLWVLAREPARAPVIFAALMRRPGPTLRFLDERGHVRDLLLLLVTLPTLVFLRAALRWLCARRRAAA